MNKILVICGPTATGKTSLGIHLAKKFSGEIVSADSRQVYIGMDIGTGKDFKGAWLLDVVKPNQPFSVAEYVKLAWQVIEDIWERGKLPIIVGGTGFYIKGLIDGIETLGVPPDWELRKKLSHCSIAQLSAWLNKLDKQRWERMNESDRKNPRRLIRAIEIASVGMPSQLHPKPYTLNPLFIGLTAPNKVLYQRIDERVDKRVKMGIISEIKKLLRAGYSWNLPAMSGMGYRQWKPYFEGRVTREEAVNRWKFAEHGYARRQLTWFKRDRRINRFDVTTPNFEKKIEKLVSKWYNLS